jgi:hypothetical protein
MHTCGKSIVYEGVVATVMKSDIQNAVGLRGVPI